jgi:GNAT superfamily N-acetyltransferase
VEEEPLEIDRVSERDFETLEAVGRLYEEAFPAAERKPRSFISEAAARVDYELLVIRAQEQVAGFAVIYLAPGHRLQLIEYMAVMPHLRGRGLGTLLFEDIVRRANGNLLLLEVEAEDPELSTESDAVRRKAFYRRSGCRQLGDLRYTMPRVAAAAPPVMHLFVQGCTSNCVSKTELATWLTDIFHRVYGVEEAQHPVQSMLRNERESIPLD